MSVTRKALRARQRAEEKGQDLNVLKRSFRIETDKKGRPVFKPMKTLNSRKKK